MVGADLVIDAGGRAGRLTRALRGPGEGGDCGIAYVSRQYQMRPGAAAGPVNMPFGVMVTYPGYLVAVFIHDNGILSALIARASADRQLAALRTRVAFEAATRAIPALAAWTDPGQARPITPVLPGGRLYNSYRGQLDDAGHVAVDGLIYAGDAVCTTNPAAGRGVTTSLLQARQLISLLAEHGRDLTSCSLAFDRWCASHIKPWFEDHVYWDVDLVRRWSGRDIDLTRPLPPDLIMAATQADPQIAKAAGPGHARPPRQPGRRPGPRPRPLRNRLAPDRASRPDTRRAGQPSHCSSQLRQLRGLTRGGGSGPATPPHGSGHATARCPREEPETLYRFTGAFTDDSAFAQRTK